MSAASVDAKQQRKYEKLVSQAHELETDQPLVALELYRQAEAIIPGSLTNAVSNLKGKNKVTTPPAPLPPPPPPFSLPDYGMDEPNTVPPPPPPPPPPPSSQTLSSFAEMDLDDSGELPVDLTELDAFLDQVVDFVQVMSRDDVEEMVSRKENQLITYLLSTTRSVPPSEESSPLADKTARCLLVVGEVVPSAYCVMATNKVVSWILLWIKYFVKRKTDALRAGEFYVDADEIIVHFLQLLSVVCGQGEPLLQSEKEQLDDFTTVSALIQFTCDLWEYDEDSPLATAATVSLFAISSQFPKASEDPIVCGLYASPPAAALGRNFIHVLNRGVQPKWLQRVALSTSQKLFEYSQAQQSECFFFTNDIHVLFDVILREVINLEEQETQLRAAYLDLLHAAVTHHEYTSKGSYKRQEVINVLKLLSDIHFDAPAASRAKKFLIEDLSET